MGWPKRSALGQLAGKEVVRLGEALRSQELFLQ